MGSASAYAWVALGGAIGAAARFGVVQWATFRWGAIFPWGTLAVNVTGSLAIGFLAAVFSARNVDPALRLLFITGVLGGYTTFSAFSFETLTMVFEQRWGAAVVYVAGSVILGVLATGLGYAVALQLNR